MRIVVLDTGLFPDRETVQDAIDVLALDHEVERLDATDASFPDSEWDHVLDILLAADRVVTL
jgi:hypothetical protein